MIKQLNLIGNTWGIRLPKAIMQLLDIDPDKSKLLFFVERETLYIRKTSEEELSKMDNPLVKNVSKAGNGYAIFVALSILEFIGINPAVDMIDIQIERNTLIIKKAKTSPV